MPQVAFPVVPPDLARERAKVGLKSQEVADPGGVDPVALLTSTAAVRDELKVTDAQRKRLFELIPEAARKSKELRQAAFWPGAAPQDVWEAGDRLRDWNEGALAKILRPDRGGHSSNRTLTGQSR